jgi:hypothetical protein
MSARAQGTLPALVAITALTLAGCGFSDPYQRPETQTGAARPATDQLDTGRAPAPQQLAIRPGEGAPSARAVAERYALAYTNWSYEDVLSQGQALARLSAGQLRDQVRNDASAAATNGAIQAGRITNRGELIAADVQPSGVIVVAREMSGARGRSSLGAVALNVYRARVIEQGGRWFVSRWESVSP